MQSTHSLPPPPDTDSVFPDVLRTLSDFRWIRGHISVFLVGAILLQAVNMLAQGEHIWAPRLIGGWGILLLAHVLLALMARLGLELMTEPPPANAIEITEWVEHPRPPAADPPVEQAAVWRSPPSDEPSGQTSSPPESPTSDPASAGEAEERVSWRLATDAARLTGDRSWLSSSEKDEP